MSEMFSFALCLNEKCPRAAQLLRELATRLSSGGIVCNFQFSVYYGDDYPDFGNLDVVLEQYVEFAEECIKTLDPDGFITRSDIPRPVSLQLKIDWQADKIFLAAARAVYKDGKPEFLRACSSSP